jgi:serine/threonine-protein kinase HipA
MITPKLFFRLIQNERWELTPAYDICFAYRPGSEWVVSQHNLSINGKRKDITLNDLLAVAKAMNIKKATVIVNQISETVKNGMNLQKKLMWKKSIKEQIGKHI